MAPMSSVGSRDSSKCKDELPVRVKLLMRFICLCEGRESSPSVLVWSPLNTRACGSLIKYEKGVISKDE